MKVRFFTSGANFKRKETPAEMPVELIVFVPPAAHVCMEPHCHPLLKPSLILVGGALWGWGLTVSAYGLPSPRSGA